MTKNIFVGGCSHVQGHGFPDNKIGSRHSMFAWPAVIEKHLDCNVINCSSAGNSTDNVIKDFLNYEDKGSLDAIVIMFPYSKRFVIKDQNGIPENFWPSRLESYKKNKKYYKAVSAYLTLVQDDTTTEHHFLAQIALINFFARKYKIPFWFGVTTDDDKLLVEKHLGYKDVFDWLGWCERKKYNLLPDKSHFDGKAHQDFSKYITSWLEKKGFKRRPL